MAKINNKNKHGSDLTLTGAIRKLSYFMSAVTVLDKYQRIEWYWDVINKAEYEARGQYKDLDVKRFVSVVLAEIDIIVDKEEKHNKEKEKNNYGK